MTIKNKELAPVIVYLTQFRIRKGLTQEQVANKIGMTLRTYQRLEQGERDPRLSEIERLCEVHGISWFDVAWELVQQHADSQDDRVIAAAVKSMPPQARRPMLDLIRAIS